jgi:hypothetical protein
MNRKKIIWRSLLISYFFAAWISVIPGMFIFKTIPPDDQIPQIHSLFDIVFQVIIAPPTAPLKVYCETGLAFLWGLDILPEGLIPIFTFISVFCLVFFKLYISPEQQKLTPA